MCSKEEMTELVAEMIKESRDGNLQGIEHLKNVLTFTAGVLANNGYNQIYNIVGDNCGKTTMYMLVKTTVEHAQKESGDVVTAKPFFIDNGIEFFNNISYDDFIKEFIIGEYTALCVDDLGFQNYVDLIPFLDILMSDKPCFFTMNSENGKLLKEKMNGVI